MLKTASVTFGGKKVVLHELDVTQTMDLVSRTRSLEQPSDLDLGNAYEFLPEFVMDEILGQPLAGLIEPGVTHEELDNLYRAALKLNPFLARAMKTMAEMVRASSLLMSGSDGLLSALSSAVTTTSGAMGSPPSSTP